MWYLHVNSTTKVIELYKNNEILKAEGNFKHGYRPTIEWVHDVKAASINANDYVVVSVLDDIA